MSKTAKYVKTNDLVDLLGVDVGDELHRRSKVYDKIVKKFNDLPVHWKRGKSYFCREDILSIIDETI